MAEEKKDASDGKDDCCGKDACGGGNGGCGSCGCGSGEWMKFALGLLLGILLAGAGFCLYSAGKCSSGSRCHGMKAMSCPMIPSAAPEQAPQK